MLYVFHVTILRI